MAVTNDEILKLQDSNTLRKELNITVRWRILTMKGGIARIVAYQDSRDVQNVLDHVCGPTNWANEPMNLGGKLYMTISINTEEGWVSKSDVGSETDIQAKKGEASDALKRAAVMWGIFRDIYQYDYIILETDGKYPITPDGIALKSPEAISTYCNGISEPMNHLRRLYLSIKNEVESSEEIKHIMGKLKNFINEQK